MPLPPKSQLNFYGSGLVKMSRKRCCS